MQRFELFTNDSNKLLSREPLSSKANYLITQSPNNHLETGKIETYQYYTFSLRIPLELDDEDYARLKMKHLS